MYPSIFKRNIFEGRGHSKVIPFAEEAVCPVRAMVQSNAENRIQDRRPLKLFTTQCDLYLARTKKSKEILLTNPTVSAITYLSDYTDYADIAEAL